MAHKLLLRTQTVRAAKDELSRPGARQNKSVNGSGVMLEGMTAEQWERFKNLTERQIRKGISEDPDAQPVPARALKHFVLTPPHVKKKSITIRVDEDVLGWYKSHGENYQKRMNHALRKWMQDEPQRLADWGVKPKKKPKKKG